MKRWRLFASTFLGVIPTGFILAVPAQRPSSSAPPLAFEVASIKPNVELNVPTTFVCHAIDSGLPITSSPPLGRCRVPTDLEEL
jgi:hypothetical protein